MVRIKEFLYTPHKVAFQFFLRLEMFPLHASLTFGAFMPIIRRHLIAADMDIFAWKKLQNFREHILYKLKRLDFAGAVHAGINASSHVGTIRSPKATKLRIRGQ